MRADIGGRTLIHPLEWRFLCKQLLTPQRCNTSQKSGGKTDVTRGRGLHPLSETQAFNGFPILNVIDVRETDHHIKEILEHSIGMGNFHRVCGILNSGKYDHYQ